MRLLNFLWFVICFSSVTMAAHAEQLQPIDLKPFVGPSPFLNINADYLLPRGKQVIDGTLFQIDGVVFIKGGSAAQKAKTNSLVIPVGKSFEKLHLLVSGQTKSPEGTTVGKIHLLYSDGTKATLELRFGDHIRNWYGIWHKAEQPLGDPNSRVAWIAQFSAAATTDDYLRLFHVTLDNPTPDKEVQSLSLESTGKPTSLMFVAMSVGSAKTEPLPNTINLPKSPFPDLRPRNGDLVRGEGVVKTRDGLPIAGAHVIVSGTRQFEDGYSENSMEDPAVGQEATTDSNGKYILPPLPDNRFYRLLTLAEGFSSATYGGMDPKSDPIEIRLTASTNSETKSKYFASAKIVDLEGKPLPFAFVQPDGIADGNGSYWGSGDGFPEQLVTDKNGEVIVSLKKPFEKVQVTVHAPNLAPAKVWLDASNQLTAIEMGAGGSIQGRVVKDGQPLAGIRLGVSGTERDMMHFAGSYYTKTDTNGLFNLAHLPPHTKWWLYGTMSSLKSQGAIQATMVESGSHGASNNVGDLLVVKGITLSGTVKTLHGEPLPKSLKIHLGYDALSDYQTATADAEGHFKFEGLHKSEVTISLASAGWHFNGNMRSEDVWNSWRLVGLIEKDKDDLLLIIEKGDIEYGSNSSSNGQLPTQDWPQNRPIAGAELSAGPPPIILAGTVLDDKTSQPIPVYKVTPGRKPPITTTGTPAPKPLLQQVLEPLKPKTIPWNERIYWQFTRKQYFTNGSFAVEFFPLLSTPILRVEADGYEPMETEPVSMTTSNLVIRLKKGAGPNGIVLLPDGTPASGATMLYAVLQEQFGLNGTAMNSYGNRKEAFFTTKGDGKFSFPRLAQGQKIFVGHPAGYVEESVERGGDNLKLRLKPWATLTGTLVYSNGTPAVNIPLNLSIDYNWQRGDPIMHIQQKTITDAQGNFLFTNVPPRHMKVDRMQMSGGGGWSSIPQTWLDVSPGITNKLGNVTYDTPPPAPMIDQLKQKLGL